MKLIDYIETHFDGNRSAFARAQGTTKQHVQKWLAGDWEVFGDTLVSVKRELKRKEEK